MEFIMATETKRFNPDDYKIIPSHEDNVNMLLTRGTPMTVSWYIDLKIKGLEQEGITNPFENNNNPLIQEALSGSDRIISHSFLTAIKDIVGYAGIVCTNDEGDKIDIAYTSGVVGDDMHLVYYDAIRTTVERSVGKFMPYTVYSSRTHDTDIDLGVGIKAVSYDAVTKEYVIFHEPVEID